MLKYIKNGNTTFAALVVLFMASLLSISKIAEAKSISFSTELLQPEFQDTGALLRAGVLRDVQHFMGRGFSVKQTYSFNSNRSVEWVNHVGTLHLRPAGDERGGFSGTIDVGVFSCGVMWPAGSFTVDVEVEDKGGNKLFQSKYDLTPYFFRTVPLTDTEAVANCVETPDTLLVSANGFTEIRDFPRTKVNEIGIGENKETLLSLSNLEPLNLAFKMKKVQGSSNRYTVANWEIIQHSNRVNCNVPNTSKYINVSAYPFDDARSNVPLMDSQGSFIRTYRLTAVNDECW